MIQNRFWFYEELFFFSSLILYNILYKELKRRDL